MNKATHHKPAPNLESLAKDAHSLMAATAEVACEKAGQARQLLSVAMESAREIYIHVRKNAVPGAKATHKVGRKHPYKPRPAVPGFAAGRRGLRKKA